MQRIFAPLASVAVGLAIILALRARTKALPKAAEDKAGEKSHCQNNNVPAAASVVQLDGHGLGRSGAQTTSVDKEVELRRGFRCCLERSLNNWG